MGGAFIVVEGSDGAGKTSLARRLGDRLRSAGFEVVEVREPGGTPVAEAAREAVLDADLDASPLAELFLILAARADLVSRVIRPALAEAKVVVGDRYDLSTQAYQVAGRQLPGEAVMAANRLATGGLVPDLTLVLDAPIRLTLERQAAEGKTPDRIENADAAVWQRVERAFHNAEGAGVIHIDATRPADEVERAAWEAVRDCLGGTRQPSVG